MSADNALARLLARHALAKPGAVAASTAYPPEQTTVKLRVGSWPEFAMFEVDETQRSFVRIPLLAKRRDEVRQTHPAVVESIYMERDGHVYADVPLTANLPTDYLTAMIDEAYEVCVAKLSAAEMFEHNLCLQPYDEDYAFETLLEFHELTKRTLAILDSAKKAVLLKPIAADEDELPLGASKFGGEPDLPATAVWPTLSLPNGAVEPLAFLLQLDLAGVAEVGTPVPGLPAAGLLSVFSVFGSMDPDWLTDNDGDANRFLITPYGAKLERRAAPEGANTIRCGSIECVPIASYPKHAQVPELVRLGWSDEEYNRYETALGTLLKLQIAHHLGDGDGVSHSLLGGHPLFQQDIRSDWVDDGKEMLLQIGYDRKNCNTMWSDGGELVFYADAKSLRKGKIAGIVGDCQGG